MAANGFALTASHFGAQSNQRLLPLSFGASPRLGMPSLRSCSVGPPPSAIHGRGRLTRHPAGLPTAQNLHSASRRGRCIPSRRGGLVADLAVGWCAYTCANTVPCGSCGAAIRLASDCGRSVTTYVVCQAVIAGKPAPTVFSGDHPFCVRHNPCRSEPALGDIPTMAVCQTTSSSTDIPSSRAGSLPQGMFRTEKSPRR